VYYLLLLIIHSCRSVLSEEREEREELNERKLIGLNPFPSIEGRLVVVGNRDTVAGAINPAVPTQKSYSIVS
jgi:hypothetical protein